MKYKDGGTSMLTKLERLVRLKGMVDNSSIKTMQRYPPQNLLRDKIKLLNYGTREDKMLRRFLKFYPKHFEELVSDNPEETKYVASEFIKRQIKLMNKGMTEKEAFQVVNESFMKELNEIYKRCESLLKYRDHFEAKPSLGSASSYNQFVSNFVKSMNFEAAFKKSINWKEPAIETETADSHFENLVKKLDKYKMSFDTNENKL